MNTPQKNLNPIPDLKTLNFLEKKEKFFNSINIFQVLTLLRIELVLFKALFLVDFSLHSLILKFQDVKKKWKTFLTDITVIRTLLGFDVKFVVWEFLLKIALLLIRFPFILLRIWNFSELTQWILKTPASLPKVKNILQIFKKIIKNLSNSQILNMTFPNQNFIKDLSEKV